MNTAQLLEKNVNLRLLKELEDRYQHLIGYYENGGRRTSGAGENDPPNPVNAEQRTPQNK